MFFNHCGEEFSGGPDWARGVCDKCKADNDPTLADKVQKIEVELEELRRLVQ